MKSFLPILKNCFLFAGLSEEELINVLPSLSGIHKSYAKNQTILNAGDMIRTIGIVLSGKVRVTEEDYWGNASLIASIDVGDCFGEAIAFTNTPNISITVSAIEKSDIFFIDPSRITHPTLSKNMMRALAMRAVALRQKIGYLNKRTTRDKLLAFLSDQAIRSKGKPFSIPFNRQDLAGFLAVDRSAMTRELAKMQQEGILTFTRSTFSLNKKVCHKS